MGFVGQLLNLNKLQYKTWNREDFHTKAGVFKSKHIIRQLG